MDTFPWGTSPGITGRLQHSTLTYLGTHQLCLGNQQPLQKWNLI